MQADSCANAYFVVFFLCTIFALDIGRGIRRQINRLPLGLALLSQKDNGIVLLGIDTYRTVQHYRGRRIFSGHPLRAHRIGQEARFFAVISLLVFAHTGLSVQFYRIIALDLGRLCPLVIQQNLRIVLHIADHYRCPDFHLGRVGLSIFHRKLQTVFIVLGSRQQGTSRHIYRTGQCFRPFRFRRRNDCVLPQGNIGIILI